MDAVADARKWRERKESVTKARGHVVGKEKGPWRREACKVVHGAGREVRSKMSSRAGKEIRGQQGPGGTQW